MRSRTRPTKPNRFRTGSLAALAVVAMAATVSACQPAVLVPITATADSVAGDAWGASASLTAPLGISTNLGQVALQVLGCDPHSNSLVVANAPSIALTVPIKLAPVTAIQAGAVTNSGVVSFNHAAGTSDVVETSSTADVSLLNGLVTATEIKSEAHVTSSAAGVDEHTGDGSTGVTFDDLKIAGVLQPENPAPNTAVALPLGLGSVVLNQQVVIAAGYGVPSQVVVNAIAVKVGNVGGVSGAITVAHAQAGLGPADGRLAAVADLASATASGVVSTGLLGVQGMPCLGTGGVDQTLTVAGENLGPVGSVGAGRSTVNGFIHPSELSSTATATVAGVNLLGGLIHADAITAEANSTVTPTGATSVATGTVFANLVVAGKPINASVAPNTTISVAGVGVLTLNQQVGFVDDHNGVGTGQFSSGLTTTGLVLRVTLANSLGLPVGASVSVASARTSASV